MTPELQDRLVRRLPPFDGSGIRNCRDLSLSETREVLRVILQKLRSNETRLLCYSDWYEHDGFQVDAAPIRWESVFAMIESDQSLFAARREDLVSVALVPKSFEWLLRFNVDEEDPADFQSALCDVDFSVAAGSDLCPILALLEHSMPTRLCRFQPAIWFPSRYGG